MKNIVFIPKVKGTDEKRLREVAYDLSVKSWGHWCKKNDCELMVMEDLVHDYEEMKITWQRYHVLEMLENSGIDYDQVCMVDADTIVHPECPNFFEMSEGKLCGAYFDGSWDWVLRSIENYSKYAFENYMMPWYKYFDCGFVLVNKNHKQFFNDIISYYFTNQDMLIQLQETFHTGTDQTPVNMLTHKHNIDLKLLPYEFNMCDMARKEILGDDLLFTKIGWIYQYNAIPNNTDNQLTNYFMKKTYEHFYGELNE